MCGGHGSKDTLGSRLAGRPAARAHAHQLCCGANSELQNPSCLNSWGTRKAQGVGRGGRGARAQCFSSCERAIPAGLGWGGRCAKPSPNQSTVIRDDAPMVPEKAVCAPNHACQPGSLTSSFIPSSCSISLAGTSSTTLNSHETGHLEDSSKKCQN